MRYVVKRRWLSKRHIVWLGSEQVQCNNARQQRTHNLPAIAVGLIEMTYRTKNVDQDADMQCIIISI